MIGHRLGNHLPAFPPGLRLLTGNMLLFVPPDRRGRQLRRHIGRRLEGYPRIIGAVLIFPFLAGLAFSLCHDLLGGLGCGRVDSELTVLLGLLGLMGLRVAGVLPVRRVLLGDVLVGVVDPVDLVCRCRSLLICNSDGCA